MSRFRIAALALSFALVTISFAKPPFMKVFVDAYKISPNSPLGKAKCLSCHQLPAPPRRNSYGLDVQAAMESVHARMLTPEILKMVEKKDSDHDGFSNLVEIRAGTLPYDKNSKPKKQAKVAHTSEFALAGLLPFALLFAGQRRKPTGKQFK